MSGEYVAPLALALILVVLTYAVAAYLRDRRPQAYVGVWRYLGERAPASPAVIAVSAAIAFLLILVIGDAGSGAATLLPAVTAAALFAFVLVLGSAAAFGTRSLVIAVPLALLIVTAVLLVPEARSAAIGGALGAIPLVLLGAALIVTRRGRATG